jgi:hypothetical protein
VEEFPVLDHGMNRMKVMVSACLTGEKRLHPADLKVTYRRCRHAVMRRVVWSEK